MELLDYGPLQKVWSAGRKRKWDCDDLARSPRVESVPRFARQEGPVEPACRGRGTNGAQGRSSFT